MSRQAQIQACQETRRRRSENKTPRLAYCGPREQLRAKPADTTYADPVFLRNVSHQIAPTYSDTSSRVSGQQSDVEPIAVGSIVLNSRSCIKVTRQMQKPVCGVEVGRG